MQLTSGAADPETARAIGAYFTCLLDDPSWVRRRVETVQVFDLHLQERRVSIDVDVAKLCELAHRFGVDCDSAVPIPMTLLVKNLFLDVDVRDADGNCLSVATSDEDSQAAHSVLLHTLDAQGLIGEITPGLNKALYAISRKMPSKDDVLSLTQEVYASRPIQAWNLRRSIPSPTEQEIRVWRKIFKNTAFKGHVRNFTCQFMPIVFVPVGDERQIIKYRYVESAPYLYHRELAEKLGLTPSWVLFEVPSIGRAERTHLRIVAPPGANIVSVRMASFQPASDDHEEEQRYSRRVALERAVLYASELRRSGYVAVARIQADNLDFLRPAFFTILISAFLLIVGGLYQRTYGPISDAQSTIALVLALPSVAAAYFARRGEHRLTSKLLSWPRALVSVSAVLSLLSAATLVAKFGSPTLQQSVIWLVWLLSGVYCLLVAGLLLAVNIRNELRTTDVRGDSWLSEEVSVLSAD